MEKQMEKQMEKPMTAILIGTQMYIPDGKRGNDRPNISSTAAVASFTENGICGVHGLSTMIPAVMMNASTFVVCIYDSVRDFMLISDEILYAAEEELIPAAVLMLFTIINHRYSGADPEQKEGGG